MLKTKKNRSVIFFFIKLILFAAVGYLIYHQFARIEESKWNAFSIQRPISFVLAVLLVIPNIWASYMKWKVTLRILHLDEDKQRNVHSYFAGLVTGMLTPNMAGNFIGRFYYFDKSYRGTITLLTLVGNFAELLSTLLLGTLAVFAVGEVYQLGDGWEWKALLVVGCAVGLLIYFFLEIPLNWIKRLKWLEVGKTVLKSHPIYRWSMLSWSILRFVIFTIQSCLLLYAFGEDWSMELIFAMSQVYLITLFFPSLILGKLGVKELVSVGILGGLGMNEFSILFSSLIIWFVNSMSPALVGLIICERPKK